MQRAIYSYLRFIAYNWIPLYALLLRIDGTWFGQPHWFTFWWSLTIFIKGGLHFIGLRILKKLRLWPDNSSVEVFIPTSIVATWSGAVAWASAATTIPVIDSWLICVLRPVSIVWWAGSREIVSIVVVEVAWPRGSVDTTEVIGLALLHSLVYPWRVAVTLMMVVKIVALEILLGSCIVSFLLVPWVALATSTEVLRFVVMYISEPRVILAVSAVTIIRFVLPFSISEDLIFSPAVRAWPPIVLLILHFIF